MDARVSSDMNTHGPMNISLVSLPPYTPRLLLPPPPPPSPLPPVSPLLLLVSPLSPLASPASSPPTRVLQLCLLTGVTCQSCQLYYINIQFYSFILQSYEKKIQFYFSCKKGKLAKGNKNDEKTQICQSSQRKKMVESEG